MADHFRFDVRRAGDEIRRRLEAAVRTAWLGLKSAGNFAGAVGIAAAGGLVGFNGLKGVRTPDPVLLQQAKERAAAVAAAATSAASERDVYLFVLALGVALLLGGIWSLYAWWRDPLGKSKAKTPGLRRPWRPARSPVPAAAAAKASSCSRPACLRRVTERCSWGTISGR